MTMDKMARLKLACRTYEDLEDLETALASGWTPETLFAYAHAYWRDPWMTMVSQRALRQAIRTYDTTGESFLREYIRSAKSGDFAYINITAYPHMCADGLEHPNKFDVVLDTSNRILCTSETPFLTSARVLLREGLAQPNDVLLMRHSHSVAVALKGKVGTAAGLTVARKSHGEYFAPYVPYPAVDQPAPRDTLSHVSLWIRSLH